MMGQRKVLSADFNPYLTWGNFLSAKALQAALGELASTLAPNVFMTLVFNRDLSPEQARKTLGRFYADLEERLLGKRFYKANSNERIISIAFVEHMNSNFHYHVLARIPRHHLPRFEIYVNQTWKKLCSNGSLDFSRIKTSADYSRISDYVRKEVFKAENYENFIISTEFWNGSLIECSQQGTLARQ